MKNAPTLSQHLSGRNNNLVFFRFLAACAVLLSHSFPLSVGTKDFLESSFLKVSFGELAVSFFFVMSGVLIAKSVQRYDRPAAYFKARCLRIFPPLAAVVLACAFLAGPLVTRLQTGAYLAAPGTWKYLLNAVLLPVHNLPGVFEGNPFNTSVNGSLWTLPVEFLCYCFCFAAHKTGILSHTRRYLLFVPIFLTGAVAAYFLLNFAGGAIQAMVRPISLFFVGMGYYVFRDTLRLNKTLAFIMLPLFVSLSAMGFKDAALILLFPYIAVVFTFTVSPLNRFLNGSDLSYGIYLWGFPIQQLVCHYWGLPMPPLVNFALALPAAILLGYLTHRFIEKPCLRL